MESDIFFYVKRNRTERSFSCPCRYLCI